MSITPLEMNTRLNLNHLTVPKQLALALFPLSSDFFSPARSFERQDQKRGAALADQRTLRARLLYLDVRHEPLLFGNTRSKFLNETTSYLEWGN